MALYLKRRLKKNLEIDFHVSAVFINSDRKMNYIRVCAKKKGFSHHVFIGEKELRKFFCGKFCKKK